jgi:hypothetical protein
MEGIENKILSPIKNINNTTFNVINVSNNNDDSNELILNNHKNISKNCFKKTNEKNKLKKNTYPIGIPKLNLMK